VSSDGEQLLHYDILAIGGSATVDDILIVDRFPAPDTKQEVLSMQRQGGGLAATACVTAARLGMRAAYADVMGEDDLSEWVVRDLEREGLDTSHIIRRAGIRPIHAIIIASPADGTRTILYSIDGRDVRDDDMPPDTAIRSAKVLLIDDVSRTGLDGLTHAVKVARAAGIPVVADFEITRHEPLIESVDHLILSQRYAELLTGVSNPAESPRALWHSGRSAVVVTCGVDGGYAYTGGESLTRYSAFAVDVVDTTGCGDVFHGAYAVGLVWGLGLEERLRLAAACAALKATQPGGRRGIPTLAQVETFLQSHK
jgi:ribokinase